MDNTMKMYAALHEFVRAGESAGIHGGSWQGHDALFVSVPKGGGARLHRILHRTELAHDRVPLNDSDADCFVVWAAPTTNPDPDCRNVCSPTEQMDLLVKEMI